MIRASIYGRLGGDAIQRPTQSGKAMATANLAVDVSRPGSGSEETEWVSIVAFGPTAESLSRQQKGDVIAAMGQLCRSRYTGRDGEERTRWSLTAENIVSARTVRPSGRPKVAPARRFPPRSGHASRGPTLPDDRIGDLWEGPAP